MLLYFGDLISYVEVDVYIGFVGKLVIELDSVDDFLFYMYSGEMIVLGDKIVVLLFE